MDLSMSECFSFARQEFLVCVTVHKARNLCVLNADTYVKVVLERNKKKTNVFQNSENPFFNELLRMTLAFEVYKKSYCKKDKCLGELHIDLASIWSQAGHFYYKKWGKLETPLGQTEKPRGHIQLDLSIASKNAPPVSMPLQNAEFEDIETNLFSMGSAGHESGSVRYFINIYKGIFSRKADYTIEGKTKIVQNTMLPEWNEQITFEWSYPSLCQTLLFRVLVNELFQWKCICDYEINLEDITIAGDLPAIGPTYFQLYSATPSHDYIGRILVSIECQNVEPAEPTIKQQAAVKKISMLEEESYWSIEEFSITCLIWEGDFLRLPDSSSIKFTIQCGEFISNSVTSFIHNYDECKMKFFVQESPHRVLLLKGFFPDSRITYGPDNYLTGFCQMIRAQMDTFNLFQLKYSGSSAGHAKCLASLMSVFREKLLRNKDILLRQGDKMQSLWTRRRTAYLVELIDVLVDDFKEFGKLLKAGGRKVAENVDRVRDQLLVKLTEIETFISRRLHDLWPDIVINLWAAGKVAAVCKLRAQDFFFSKRSECMGRFCGHRRNFIFKPITCSHSCKHCGCIFGKIDAWIWISTESERKHGVIKVDGWAEQEHHYYKVVSESYFNCNVYIHQARIRPGSDRSGLSDPKIRITFLNLMHETQPIEQTLAPVWNEKVSMENLKLPGSAQSYLRNPPLIVIELLDEDSKSSSDYLGCGFIQPSIQSLNLDLDAITDLVPSSQMNLMNVVDDEETIVKSPRKSKFLEIVKRPNRAIKLQNFARTKVIMQELQEMKNLFPPPLKWLPVSMQGIIFGEVLASAELIEVEADARGDSYVEESVKIVSSLPLEICPVMRRYRVDVFFAGVRNYRKMPSGSSGRYKLSLMLGDLILSSGPSSLKFLEGENFLDSLAAGVVKLPEQLEYWPQIVLTHIDCSKPKQCVTIGAAVLNNSTKYLKYGDVLCCDRSGDPTVTPSGNSKGSFEKQPLIGARSSKRTSSITELVKSSSLLRSLKLVKSAENDIEMTSLKREEEEFNWWTKFYNSMHQDTKDESEQNLKHKLVIYDSELETQPEFSFLQDWAEGVNLTRGIVYKTNRPPREETYCTVKCHIEVRKCQSRGQSSIDQLDQGQRVSKIFSTNRFQEVGRMLKEVPVLVRVYIVQGIRIRPVDASSDSDPYVRLQFGSQKINDRANFIPNQSNPVFGKIFQLEGTIPREHNLHISIYDHNCCDKLIGCTSIDLEDRLRSKHRATVGIANEYSRSGYNLWRDYFKPFEILKQICKNHNLQGPEVIGNKMVVGSMTFEDDTEIAKDERLQERLSVAVLKKLDQIPEIGYCLVPEHVETRSLYRLDRPGIEQGKLQMWVEIFNPTMVPLPIDITPAPHLMYELRVIVWNTADVILDEKNVFGKSMSDIYVKGWLDDIDMAQYTDVHYRSLTGEGNFNWRMIFPIKYSKVEDMMVTVRKGIYGHHDTELKLPAMLYVQVWDNDTFSADDFLGATSINLSHFPEPFSSLKSCKLSKDNKKFVNLFKSKTVKGWFPLKGKLPNGSLGMTGKIELELEILNDIEAATRPAGLGRDPPEALLPPERPETSFRWFTDPLASFKYILGPIFRKYLIYIVLSLITIIVVVAVIFLIPRKMFDSITDTY